MSQNPYLTGEDDDDLEDYFLTGEDDEDVAEENKPYDSLKGNLSAQDENPPSRAQQVMSQISSKYEAPPEPMPTLEPEAQPEIDSNYSSDPLLQSYEQDQQKLGEYRNQANAGNLIANLGQAGGHFARGSLPPESSNPLYSNIRNQNSEMLRSKTQELGKRAAIIQSIEARKARERVADKIVGARKLADESKKQERKEKQDFSTNDKINRTMSTVLSKINTDPVIKPSEQNVASLRKSKMLLDNPYVPVTPQVLADAEQDIASALTLRGQGATEGKIARGELITYGREWAKFLQKVGDPEIDLREKSPELVNQIKKVNQALIDDYVETIRHRKLTHLDEASIMFGDKTDDIYHQRLGALRDKWETDYQNEKNLSDIPVKKYKKLPNGIVRIRDPKGIIRLVPEKDVDALINKGGKVVE